MRTVVWTTTADAPAIQAARTLSDHVFGCLPVTEDGKLVGIVTEADFLSLLVERHGLARRDVPRHDMPVHHYMSSPVRTVSPDDGLDRVEALLEIHGISSLAVVDGDGAVAGVISQSDLLRVSMARLAAKRRPGARHLPRRTVGEIMTADVITVRLDDTVARAARSMVEHDVHRVFATDGRRPFGVFSTLDAMRAVRDIGVRAPVSAFMTSVIFAVELSESVSAAVKLLDRASVSGVIVLDDGWPVGVFTQREVLASRHLPRDTPVEHAMSQAFICVPGRLPLYRVAGQAAALGVRRVIVFGEGEVEGVLTGMDFARACAGDAF